MRACVYVFVWVYVYVGMSMYIQQIVESNNVLWFFLCFSVTGSGSRPSSTWRPLLAAASVVVNKLKLLPLPEFQFVHLCEYSRSSGLCVWVCVWRLEVCQNLCRFSTQYR